MRRNQIIWFFLGFLLVPGLTFASTYGSNFITGGSISSNVENCNGGSNNTSAKSVDGNTATLWCSGNTANSYLIYDLGSGVSKEFGQMHIMPYSDGGGKGFKNFTVYGSNDGSSYTSIYTDLSPNSTGASAYEDYYTPTSTLGASYRYYKLAMADSWRSGNDIAVVEWQMYECLVGCSNTPSSTTSTLNICNSTICQQDLQYIFILFICFIFSIGIWIATKMIL